MSANWLLRAHDEPAANLAAYIHDREKLALPVPIEEMVGAVATIERHNWPYTCDALVVGLLDGEKKTIFVKQGIPWRRVRFTLAHEFGHIMMSWHLGLIACKLSTEAFSVEPLGPAVTPEDLLAHQRLKEQEAEATRFASYLLMPEYFIRPLVSDGNLNHALTEASKLNVSAHAIVMRLSDMLQPGFAFVFSNGQQQLKYSSGTVIPRGVHKPYGVSVPDLKRAAKDSGSVTVSEKDVHWFRLVDFDEFTPVIDPRTTTEILKSAIASHVDDPEERDSIFRSLNGVAGGSLSKERATTREQVLGFLRHRFDGSRHTSVVEDPEFDLYLRRKTDEWAQKRGI